MKEGNHRPNLNDLNLEDFLAVQQALRRGQTDIASEIIGEHLRRIAPPVPEKPQVVPPLRTQEVAKKHIKRSGKR